MINIIKHFFKSQGYCNNILSIKYKVYDKHDLRSEHNLYELEACTPLMCERITA